MDNLDRILVVDADGHVNEGDVDLSSRLPEAWRSQGPVSLKDNQGYPRILLEGRIWGTAQGPGPSVTGPFTDKARKDRPGMTDPLQRLKDMDEEGIDVAILFGTQIALTVNGLMNKELAAVLCRAVNDWLIDYCSADKKRLLAVGLIPCQDPPAAVKELEYLKKVGAITAMLPTNVYGLNNMGDPMFDPIYDCAQSLEMPLSVHPQTGHDGVLGVSGVMGAGSERFRKYAYVHMTAFPFELMIAMMHMIGEGVFDRYPKLRVGFMEGGAGWLPFWAERFDEHIEKLAPQMPELKRRPSDIIRSEQITLTCESEETGLDRVFAANCEDTVMYASDYCHWDCHFPYSVKGIIDGKDLSFEQQEKLLSKNAIEFFALKNLPQPRALKIARQSWDNDGQKKAATAWAARA